MKRAYMCQNSKGGWFRYDVDSSLISIRNDGAEIETPEGDIIKGRIVTFPDTTFEEVKHDLIVHGPKNCELCFGKKDLVLIGPLVNQYWVCINCLAKEFRKHWMVHTR